jgi:hypothetical protein
MKGAGYVDRVLGKNEIMKKTNIAQKIVKTFD